MKGYFLTVLIASVCGATCVLLSWGGFERYIKYVASVVCLVLLISPLREIDVSELDIAAREYELSADISDDDILYRLSGELTEKNAEEYISELVFSQFGIKTVSTDIKIDWDSQTPTVESIEVSLSAEDADKCEAARVYLSGLLGGEVRVIES